MSLSDEYIVMKLIQEAQFYIAHQDENESYLQMSQDCIFQIDVTLKKNVRESFIEFSPELIIQFCETCLLVPGKVELARYYAELFFQRTTSQGQFYIRGLLLRARLQSMSGHEQLMKAEEMISNLQKALNYVVKALEIIGRNDNRMKYSFLIYNASTCVYEIIRPMLKPNWQKSFTDILDRIDRMFDEVDEQDYNWRCRFTWLLFYCLYDGDKKPEAFKVLDRLWETTKRKGDCDFQDGLLRLRIHMGKENKAYLDSTGKDAGTAPGEKAWKPLLILQRMKSGLIPEAQVEKELINLINSISSAVLPGNEVAQSNRLAPVFQERLAEAGRVALQFNLVNIADSITNFLNRVRQLNLRAHILHEYNKAELYIKKAGPIVDNKTGMRLNSVQVKQQEIERRIEALKIMEKVMITNKKQNDPDLIYEGAVVIWNISLPFLNAQQRQYVYKAFQSGCQLLEFTQSVDHALRVNFHIELAKSELLDDFAVKAEAHVRKALSLDYSTPLNKLQFKIDDDEDVSLYQRPYDKYLQALSEKIRLKQNIYADPKNEIERVILNLESASLSKSENMRIDILQKCLGSIVNLQEGEYMYDPSKDLVEDEITREKLIKKQENLYQYKQKKLLAAEIAKMAFEWELNDLATKACEFVCADTWEVKNASEMILVQVECFFRLAQIVIDTLLKENFEIAFADPVRVEENEGGPDEELGNDKKEWVLTMKRKLATNFLRGLKLADSIKQTWLVFNGAIYIWNNFLPIFRNPINDTKLLPEITNLLREFFETMKNALKEIEKKSINDYDIDTKIQVLANIGLIYTRLMENRAQYDEVMRVCEALLLTPLSPHTRKLINSIKARVSGVAKTGGVKAAPVDPKGQAGKPKGPGTSSDSVLFDVVSQLEIIQNSTNKSQTQELIKKCFETLLTWTAKENDETELELHAELWARLARLALNEENALMYKYSLRSVQNSLQFVTGDVNGVPQSRLRWYSLAEYIYSENLMRMINTETQETESQERLLFYALKHAIEAANKGLKASINSLVLDASKQVWNICARLEESAQNRKHLIKPVFSTLFYLKECREKSEPDLVLLLAQLLFKSTQENEDYKLGEQAADMIFELVPKNMQKPIWEAKMIFMSKQGKNELQAISNMKEADASLQAKVWMRLARSSNNVYKQYTAYNKALEILKKENSVEIVEILIEFAEWLLRNGNEKHLVIEHLNMAADTLIDIEMDEEDEDEEPIDDGKSGTVFSRSTRGKKSTISKNSKTKSKAPTRKSGKQTIKSQKKGSEQKSQASQSKGSSNQRFSRAANNRTSKTIKSKQSKSIFTQREEDSNPETLNCAHFERLMRIHAMLAMIADTMEEQVQLAIDAKVFLVKIIEVSFKTMNQMEENASKYTNIIDEKTGKQTTQIQKQEEFIPKYLMPKNIGDWIKLQFSKEFIEKVNNYEDYNFMGKFLFEKAQLTYTYVNNLINIFEQYGLHVHSVPLYVFQRFLVKEILSNQHLLVLIEIRLARSLHLLGFHVEADALWVQSGAVKFKISEQEKKLLLAKTESSIVQVQSKGPSSDNDENLPQPNIIYNLPHHETWVHVAGQLTLWGETVRAQELLQEAHKHAIIIQDTNLMSTILINQAQLSYLDGDYKQSLEYHKIAHKMIKNVGLWEHSAIDTFKTLTKLGKLDDIKNFLKKIIEVFIEVLTKPNYQPNKVQISQTLGTLYILQGRMVIKELSKEFQYEMWRSACDSLDKAVKCIVHGGFQTHQIEMIVHSLNKFIIKIRQKNWNKLSQLDVYFKIYSRITALLMPIEQEVRKLLKYTLLIEQESESLKSPLMHLHGKVKVLLAICYNDMGLIKQIRRQEQLPEIGEDDRMIFDEESINNESVDKVNQIHSYEPLQKFLTQLNFKIERALQPLPQRLESYEKSAAILMSCERQMNKNCFWWMISQIELVRAKRLLANQKGQLNDIWGNTIVKIEVDEDDKADDFDYKTDALQLAMKLTKEIESSTYLNLKKNEKKGIPMEYWIFQFKQFNFYIKQLQEQFLELIGKQIPEVAYEYMAKLQHYNYNDEILTLVKSAFQGKHKFISTIRFNKMLFQSLGQLNLDVINSLTQENKLWSNIMIYPDYKDLIQTVIPPNSAYIILQQSPNKQYIYLGCMVNVKGEKKYQVERIGVKQNNFEKLESLKQRLKQIKNSLVKTPIGVESDFIKLEDEQEEEYIKLFAEIQEYFNFIDINIRGVIDDIGSKINTDQETLQADTKKGSKLPEKPVQKKGPKDDVGAYESPLPPSPGGIESLVILMDSSFYQLPIEYMKVFQNVPAISRDFSLLLLGRRFKSIQYQPALNNATRNLEKDKIKFITYDFKEEEPDIDFTRYNAQTLLSDIQKILPSQYKLEGTHSSTRLCSLGELQKYSSNGSTLMYYGSPPVLNILSPRVILNLSEINTLRFCAIFDKMNAQKNIIDKFSQLDPESEKTPILEQSLRASAFFTLIDVATILTNQWAPQTPEMLKSFETMIKGISEEIYIAASLLKYRESVTQFIDENGQKVDQKLIEQSQQALQTKDTKKPSKLIQQQSSLIVQKLLTQEQLSKIQEVKVSKKTLYIHNFIFVGIPILRVS